MADRDLNIFVRLRDRASKALNRIGGGIASIGRFALKSTLAIVGMTAVIGALAFNTGKNFEFAIAKTAAVANATEAEYRALEATARDVGARTAFSATQVGDAMLSLASAGLETFEIVNSVEDALKLAGAASGEMSQATKILASTMLQFNLTSAESARIADVYAAAISNSQFQLDSLTEAMKFAGTTGAALGMSLEETVAAVAQFANLGLEGSMAGTNFRMAMVNIMKVTPKLEKSLKRIGVQYKDINPQANNFGEILKTLADTSIDVATAIDIFGVRAGANMAQLIDLAREGDVAFDELLTNLQESSGRAAEMYDRMMNTVEGRWQITKSAAEETLLSIFDIMSEGAMNLLEIITNIFNSISFVIKDNMVALSEIVKGTIDIMKDLGQSWVDNGNDTLTWSAKLRSILPTVVEIMRVIALSISWVHNAFGTTRDLISLTGLGLIKFGKIALSVIGTIIEANIALTELVSKMPGKIGENAKQALQEAQTGQAEFIENLTKLDNLEKELSSGREDRARNFVNWNAMINEGFDKILVNMGKITTAEDILSARGRLRLGATEEDETTPLPPEETEGEKFKTREEMWMEHWQNILAINGEGTASMTELWQGSSQQWINAYETFGTGMTDITADYISGMISGTQTGTKGLLAAVGKLIGGMAQQWGQNWILMGLGKIAEGLAGIDPGGFISGAKLIAAGTALKVFGAALGGGGRGAGAGAGAGGRGGAGAFGAPSPTLPEREEPEKFKKTRIVIDLGTLEEEQIVTNIPAFTNRIVSELNFAFERDVDLKFARETE